LDHARRWRGKPIPGQRLLVASEGGFGDHLMMFRFRDMLAARSGADLAWEVPPELVTLARVNLPDDVVPQRAPLPPHDAWVHFMSLPFVCGVKQLADVPPAPYLTAPA
jgi:hypothetical protein